MQQNPSKYLYQDKPISADPAKVEKIQEVFKQSTIYSRHDIFMHVSGLKKQKKLTSQRSAQYTLIVDSYKRINELKISPKDYSLFLYELNLKNEKYKSVQVTKTEFEHAMSQLGAQWPAANASLLKLNAEWGMCLRAAETKTELLSDAAGKLVRVKKNYAEPKLSTLAKNELRAALAIATKQYTTANEELTKAQARVAISSQSPSA